MLDLLLDNLDSEHIHYSKDGVIFLVYLCRYQGWEYLIHFLFCYLLLLPRIDMDTTGIHILGRNQLVYI